MRSTATALLLSALLGGLTSPNVPQRQQSPPNTPATPVNAIPVPKTTTDEVLRGDDAHILVFPGCGGVSRDDVTAEEYADMVQHCPAEVVYELGKPLSEGRLQIFNDGEITAEFPLLELSAEKHVTTLPQTFYWKENNETFPDPAVSCSLGKIMTTISASSLWDSHSEESAYDYKSGPAPKEIGDPPADLAASLNGEDVGFASLIVPALQNLKTRKSGRLPEIELLGVGFAEGTMVECGRGYDSGKGGKSPLRDIRVVSTVEHDLDPDIKVLQASRFTVPAEVFDYPHHIRIVGRPK